MSSVLLDNQHNMLVTRDILDEATQDLISNSLSIATRRAYATDWKIFSEFCQQHEATELPVEQSILIAFITDQAIKNKGVQTIRRRLAAIKFMHHLHNYDLKLTDKIISLVLKGVARENKSAGTQNRDRKKPISAALLSQMISYCDEKTLIGKRDKALMLFTFAGAFRRSEVCAVTLDDLEETPEGLRVYIPFSKGDQTGKGQVVALPFGRKMGVITALKSYLEAANIYDGTVFRAVTKGGKCVTQQLTPLSVSLIIKKYIQLAGHDPKEYGAHSMRSGFLTEAAENGANIFKMLEVSRHKSADTLLGYIRQSNLFKDHAGDQFL